MAKNMRLNVELLGTCWGTHWELENILGTHWEFDENIVGIAWETIGSTKIQHPHLASNKKELCP